MGVQIGQVEISGYTALAPLAGVTNRAFRLLCREQGASLAVTEMVSARGLADGSERSSEYLDFEPDEFPVSVQVFGSDPDVMAEGARVAAERKPDLIDINCGCPVKKIVNQNAGAALLKDLSLLEQIISAIASAVDVPVTLKIRSGWEEGTLATEVAKMAEGAGAAAIAVHGRTRRAGFSGEADWDVIREVKEAVSIPVIGNGDVRSPEAAKAMITHTGCDMVMVGRWAIGNPWLFHRMETYLETGVLLEEPSARTKVDMAVRHLGLSVETKGELKGVREMRRHLAAYMKGLRGAAAIRQELMTEDDPERVELILRRFLVLCEADCMEEEQA